MRTKITICVYCLSIYVPCLAQTFTFRNYSVPQGLPSSEVYDVHQDSKGFIWFATDNGVVRFDGLEMLTFGVSDGLHDPVVFEIIEDNSNRIWFRTFSNQLFYFEAGKILAYKYNELTIRACARTRLNSLHIDSTGQIWFTNLWGVMSRIDNRGGLLRDSIPAKQVIYSEGDTIHFIGWQLHDKTKKFWDYYLNIDDKVFFVGSRFMPGSSLIRTIRWKGKLYVAFANVIFEYDGVSLRKVFMSGAQILSLARDSQDNLWIGYHNGAGIDRFNSSEFINPFKPSFAKNRSVSKIYFDNDAGLWVATLDRGVFYVPNVDVEFREYPDRVNSVFSFGDSVFVTTDDGVVTIMQSKRELRSEKVSDVLQRPLFMDSRGSFWIPGKGMKVLNKSLVAVKIYDKFSFGPPANFAEDENGNVWGLAYSGYYLRKFDSTGRTSTVISDSTRKVVRTILLVGSDLYISGALGLTIYDATAMKFKHAPPSLSTFKISKMVDLNDSTLLLATVGNGLLVVDKQDWSFDKYSKINRLMSDNIYSITNKNGLLWLGTEEGILTTDLISLINKRPNFTQFSDDHGLKESKTNFLAVTDSLLWAFCDTGISIVPLNSFHSQNHSVKFYLKKLSVNKKTVETWPDIQLPYDSSNIEIWFGFLSLKNQNILCRYKLNPQDSWIYATDRRLQFASLAPSKYQLEIQYSIDNLIWHTADFQFNFEVKAPWWRIWYFQVVALIAAVTLIYFYLKNHYRTLHSHRLHVLQTEHQTLERERKRIAKELHDGVATNLSAIKLTVGHLLREHPLAGEVNDNFHSTLKEIKTIIYELTPPGIEQKKLFQSLRAYINQLSKAVPVKIKFETIGEEIHNPELGLITFRIVQELLANSIKHSGASNVFLKMESTQTFLYLVFQDNGAGFSFDDSKGLGLANVKSRIKSVNGNFTFKSVPNMTTFTIQLPLGAINKS